MRSDIYDKYSDEELIVMLRDGEAQITDYLMDKYKNMVKSKAKAMFILGGDSDDLIQEGMIGLFKALRDYDPARDASFKTFALLCVSRQMFHAVESANRKKHSPLNSYVSLYGSMSEGEGADTFLAEGFRNLTDRSPEEVLIDKERVAYIEEEMDKRLSNLEKQVLDLYMTGMSYTEIAGVLGRDEKSTDNALQRIKSKISKIIKQ